jgi:hypothetical protein
MRRRLPLPALGLPGIATVVGVLVLGIGVVAGLSSSVAAFIQGWTLRPRVVTGADAFETVTVTEDRTERQTGEFDGAPGEDVAIIDFGSVQLLNSATLTVEQRLELDGQLRSRWTPASRLARMGGTLVIVDTGGGLDDTRVRDLDGTERWRYRPHNDIPATSLVPADLDGDGSTEFYATITSYAVRLDETGDQVWRAPFSVGRVAATAPRTRRDAGWVVAEGQGETVVWDEVGTRLAGMTMKDARPVGVIDWPDGRYVLAGGSALRAIRLDGTVVFDWAVPDMTVTAALPVLLEPGTPPAVALIAASPREINRWRLQIVSRDKTLLYDELLDTPTALLKARGADGADRLFLDRASLLALRRRSG